jgi:hypothetical protein
MTKNKVIAVLVSSFSLGIQNKPFVVTKKSHILITRNEFVLRTGIAPVYAKIR